jgi:hypothetical protein
MLGLVITSEMPRPRPLLRAVIDALSTWAVLSLFATCFVLSGVGQHYGLWNVSRTGPDDRPMIHAVKQTANDVFSAVDVIVEETGEEL